MRRRWLAPGRTSLITPVLSFISKAINSLFSNFIYDIKQGQLFTHALSYLPQHNLGIIFFSGGPFSLSHVPIRFIYKLKEFMLWSIPDDTCKPTSIHFTKRPHRQCSQYPKGTEIGHRSHLWRRQHSWRPDGAPQWRTVGARSFPRQ